MKNNADAREKLLRRANGTPTSTSASQPLLNGASETKVSSHSDTTPPNSQPDSAASLAPASTYVPLNDKDDVDSTATEAEENIADDCLSEFDDNPWSRCMKVKLAFVEFATIASVSIEPLFNYFMLMSILDLQLGGIVEVAAYFLVLNNFIIDMTATNPVEDARDWISKNEKAPINSNCAHKMGSALTVINRIFIMLSFANFSLADAVAIADLTSNKIAKYVSGAAVTGLGLVYYTMFTGNQVRLHSQEFARRLCTLKSSMMVDAFKNPSRSFEVFAQVLSNMCFRSAANAYIALETAKKVFGLKSSKPGVLLWMITAAALTFESVAFSRLLQVKNKFFNEKFDAISDLDLKRTPIPRSIGTVIDTLAPIIRGVTAAFLVYEFGPANQVAQWILACVVGLALGMHNAHALYTNRRYETALANAAPVNNDQPAEAADIRNLQDLGNLVTKTYKTANLVMMATAILFLARVARLISFYGFVTTIRDATTDYVRLNNWHLAAITLLWGIPTQIAEGRAYLGNVLETWAYHRSKWDLGAPEAYANSNRVTRALATYVTPWAGYGKAQLQGFVHSLINRNAFFAAAGDGHGHQAFNLQGNEAPGAVVTQQPVPGNQL